MEDAVRKNWQIPDVACLGRAQGVCHCVSVKNSEDKRLPRLRVNFALGREDFQSLSQLVPLQCKSSCCMGTSWYMPGSLVNTQ